MGQSVASIRSGIAAKIAGITGFQESKQTPDYFGRTQDTIAHLGFTVGVPSSAASEDRQRRTVGVYLNTQYRVIFAYRFRPLDAYPTDYDLALDKESEVINTVLESYSTNNQFTLKYNGSSRAVPDSQEYIIITIDYTANHTI
jgi:hypothetical protein